GEPCLPETQYVLWNLKLVSNLADRAKRLGRLVQRSLLPGVKCAARLLSRLSARKRIVDALLHDVACSEYEHAPRRDRNFLTRLWVASDPLTFVANSERAEGGELHGVAAFEARYDLTEH